MFVFRPATLSNLESEELPLLEDSPTTKTFSTHQLTFFLRFLAEKTIDIVRDAFACIYC